MNVSRKMKIVYIDVAWSNSEGEREIPGKTRPTKGAEKASKLAHVEPSNTSRLLAARASIAPHPHS